MTAAAPDATGRGWITSINGPVLSARIEGRFQMQEAIWVGERQLLGEVLRLDGQMLVAQVYEDTTGLRPDDPIQGSGRQLAVWLGPGIVGGIYDGLLRPLDRSELVHVEPGRADSPDVSHAFTPVIEVGQRLGPGALLGHVGGADRRQQSCLLAPDHPAGRVVTVAGPGDYPDTAAVAEMELDDGRRRSLSLGHWWPVRRPRPALQRLPTEAPLLTGQRLIDALFPVGRGSRAAMPGGFGTGKTILQQSIAKWCDADIIIYVGCGERGNEMTEVLHEFPQLEDPRTGRKLIERSVVIANTSNMPVAAREASIYTGVTVAEYFRDQGLHVALMADSTSRWAEALREIAGRLGELPAEAGYPAYLGTRKAEFYERAARVRTLAGEEGSVTLIGAVSPPGGDFSEPVTLHTQRNARCFWPLDRDRARARFYPAIQPLLAYSEDAPELEAWWQQQGYPEREKQRKRWLTLLEDQARIERMARIVGAEALPPRQRLTLLCADLVNDAFLRQSAFSVTDSYTAPGRQIAMMRVLDHVMLAFERGLESGVTIEALEQLPVLRRLRRMGEDIGNDELERFDQLAAAIDHELGALGNPAGEGESHDR